MTSPPAEAGSLVVALIRFRYERFRHERRSMTLSDNEAFGARAGILGEPVDAAAMLDRLVHRAKVIVLKGDGYRLRDERDVELTGTSMA